MSIKSFDRSSDSLIKEVFSDNLAQEMERLSSLIDKYPYIAMVNFT